MKINISGTRLNATKVTIRNFGKLQESTIGFIRYKLVKNKRFRDIDGMRNKAYGEKYDVRCFTKTGLFIKTKLLCIKENELLNFILKKSKELREYADQTA